MGLSSTFVPLISILVACVIILVVLVFLFLYLRKKGEIDYDSPEWQINELKKRTVEFGVKFSELQFGSLLGKGSQGEVYRAYWRGTCVAVKKVDTRKVDPDIVEEFCQEAEIMRRLRHPCLTLFMGVSLDHPQLCIVSEIVARGSLFDLLHDENGGYTWSRAMQIALDVASGMTYLHQHNPPILHRDLKSLNILITDQWRAKVADFGMTRFQEEGTMTQCGSPLWMAPEMIKNDPYDEKSDVYSFGICLWELYTRQIPYRELGLNPSQLVVRVVKESLRPSIPRTAPKSFARLVERCWHPIPEKRPTFAQILKIIETFILDPAIMQHKPIINGEREMEDVVPIVHDEVEQPDFDLLGVDAWRIEDKSSVEILDPVISTTSSSPTQESDTRVRIRVRDHHQNHHHNNNNNNMNNVNNNNNNNNIQSFKQAYKGKYRGKTVFVHKHFVSAFAAGILVSPANPPPPHLHPHQHHHPSHHHHHHQHQPSTSSSFTPPLSSASSSVSASSCPSIIPPVDLSTNASRIWSIMKSLGDLRHPNIVLFMGAYIERDHVVVVEEEMKKGRCSDILADSKFHLHWDTMLQFLMDSAAGMCYLHLYRPSGVVHQDLTTSRLLVDHNWRVKISGYGFINLEDRLLNRLPPPNVFTAPELFEQGNQPTTASNVYSFAMIMYHILTRRVPYDGRFSPDLARGILNGERLNLPSLLSSTFAALIQSCWHTQPSKRPTFTQVLDTLNAIKAEGPPRLELNTRNATHYRKAKTVVAFRSKDAMTILKDWGKNIGKPGSWLLISEEEDLYMLDPQVFKHTYEPVPHREYEYRKIGMVLARMMNDSFVIKTDSGIEQGNAGDYLLQNEKGDQWAVEAKTFAALYEKVAAQQMLPPGTGTGTATTPLFDAHLQSHTHHTKTDLNKDEKRKFHNKVAPSILPVKST